MLPEPTLFDPLPPVKMQSHAKYGRKHGMYKTREYKSWVAMIERCSNLREKNYGGRGIKVCQRWRMRKNLDSEASRAIRAEHDKIVSRMIG